MMHPPSFTAALVLLSSVTAAQDHAALQLLIDTRFAAASEADTSAFVQEAKRLGYIRDGIETIRAKAIFRSYMASMEHRRYQQSADIDAPTGNSGISANNSESECNDVAGFADPMTLSPGQTLVVNGAVDGPFVDPTDIYRLELVGGPEHELVIRAAPTGTATWPPTIVTLRDVAQVGIAEGLWLGPARSINKIKLPDGIYYLEIGSAVSSGSYALTLSSTRTSIPVLADGTTGSFTLAPEIHTYRLDVGGAGVRAASVHVSVTNRSSSDTGDYVFDLGRAKGGRVLFMDDVLIPPATRPQNDPVIDAALPSGTYYLFLREFNNAVTNAGYTIRHTATPLPSVPPAIGTTNYTMAHGGSFVLFDLQLPTIDHFRLVVDRPGVSGGEPVVEVYDREMGQIQRYQGRAPVSTPNFTYGDATLPPNQYWVLVRHLFSHTDANFGAPWLLTGINGLSVNITALEYEDRFPILISAGGHYAFTHRARTDTPLTVECRPNETSLVGADGLRRDFARVTSTTIHEGELIYGLLAQLNHHGTDGGWVNLAGKLGIYFEGGTAGYRLKSRDKVGNFQALFLSLGPGPGQALPPIAGKLCLDPATLTSLGSVSFTTSSRFTWPFPNLAQFMSPRAAPGIRFQALSVDPQFNASFTNVAQ